MSADAKVKWVFEADYLQACIATTVAHVSCEKKLSRTSRSRTARPRILKIFAFGMFFLFTRPRRAKGT